MSKNGREPSDENGKLGTFAGVFTPSVLTILGLILFLRLGYIVGEGGIVRALGIILIANAISVLTSISLSAIATNLRVKGGGDYYVISRTLGVEYGGSLGLVLFLAQSVSIAFYALGFAEAVSVFVPDPSSWFVQALAALAVAGLFLLAWLGADWATRFQYVVMAVLVAAIVGFFVGGLPEWSAGQFSANLQPAGALPFWALFALFFPAVTGFTQGVSMSGDLRDPGRSLPTGTFAAVFLSLFVYIALALLFAGALPGAVLSSDYSAPRGIASLPWLVDLGVIAATLSSALASFLGAPRILQSLAADHVFPILNPFAEGVGAGNNPRRGVLLTAGIAFATIAIGELNLIAPIVSMFFLISYGLLNYATFVEARANSPYFRPRFRWFHQRWSLLGGLACLGAMLAIQPLAGLAAVLVLFALYQYIARTVSVERWADSDRSHRFQRIRRDLHAISRELEHPRDWRPVVLAFSDDPSARERLLRFAEWLEGKSGFTTAIRLIKSSGSVPGKLRKSAELELREDINRKQLPAFAKVIVADDLEQALPVVLQAHGLGRVRANTALVNWYDGAPAGVTEARTRLMREALRFGVNLVMLSADETGFDRVQDTERKTRKIDVWYRDNASGRLMLMLGYLMTRNEAWSAATLRVFVPSNGDGPHDEIRERMMAQLEDYRVSAEAHVVDRSDTKTILEQSSESAVVFLPFRLRAAGPQLALEDPEISGVTGLGGIVTLVLASQDLELDAEPESGKHGEIAQAEDAADAAGKSLTQIEKELARAQKEVERLEQGEPDSTPHRDAIAKLEKLQRREARTRSKATAAIEEAEKLKGPGPDEG